jgi:ribosomal protein S8
MSLSNLLSNLKICLKKKKVVLLQKESKIIVEVLNSLWDEKIISGYQTLDNGFLKVYLKYTRVGKSFIRKIFLVSTSGRKVLVSNDNKILFKSQNNFLFFIKTTEGIFCHTKAILNKKGGEILFRVDF